MSLRDFRVGLIGCGEIATQHVRALKRMKHVRVVGVCDISEKAAIRISKEWNIENHYTDFRKMLDQENLDIVSILTPVPSHVPLAIEAVNHRINVLVEKPLTMNTRDAKRILDCVQNSGVSLTVNYNWLMGKAMQNGLQAVRRGEIGRPLGIRVECLHTKDDPMTSDEGHWCHLLPGGRFGEMLSHPVYILQAVMGDELDLLKVHAEKRGLYPWMRYDELNALLKAENGTGSIYVSFNAPRLSTVVDVFGTEKIMRIDLANQTCLEMGYRGLRKSDLALDSLDLSRKLFFSTLRKTFTYLLPHPGQAAFQGTYESLIDCIQNDKPLLVTAKMAYNTVKTVEVICNEL